MFDASAMLLGFGLGLSHATEADHVAVVSTLIHRETSSLRAARVAALWGFGHAGSFLGVGLCIVLAELRIPESFERLADILVSALLIGLGSLHLIRGRTRQQEVVSAARPVTVGLLHGLAGSAAIALLAATTIRSALGASLYLVLFGLGTVLGMSGLAFVLSWPIAWANRREGPLALWLFRAPGIFSLALGIFLAASVFLPSAAGGRS